MATVTLENKSSNATVTLDNRSSVLVSGSPIGLLLTLTRAEIVYSTVVTLENKS